MLERMQLFPLNFYKKAKFNGSMGKMNYRLAKEEKKTDEENSETILVGSIWEGSTGKDHKERIPICRRRNLSGNGLVQ